MSGKSLIFFLSLALAACADPKYVTQNQTVGGSGEQKLSQCQAQFASGACVSLNWETMPSGASYGSFLFKVFRANKGDGSAVPVDIVGGSGATLTVLAWMPSMGHGAPPIRVEQLDVGTYRASNVFFTMKGDWEIRVQVKNGNAVQDQAVFSLSL